ncbi:MAG: hypothetical protein KGM42_11935 [Hyphomicrobiales bacterium]|nr:hypothetical protein [Hyphomicrobiales bacterium]
MEPAVSSNAFRTPEEMDYRRAALVAIERLKELNAQAVRRLRYDLFRGDALTRDEADALFDIERAISMDCPDWSEFFIDTIVDYLLWQQRPSGVLNEAKAEWLIAQVDRTKTLPAFAILVAALQEAERVPGWFAAAVRGRAVKGWAGVEIARAA